MLKANSVEVFMRVYGEEYNTPTKLLRHLHSKKGESALALLKTTEPISYPQYILDAISHVGQLISND